ncbi:hypothetical protein DFP72DRAFT_825702 [Ephemerocybe angulata]|uniref:HNH nuclease domain-containing protein n=1 Tax=Ephemerocybe angulata TaxID=980116 RepID=A0A8H6HDM4_9AGAR|nr:hypothetical protein DFP72DRAFT_825702 [Tulosesus angulatus]
MIPDPPAPTEIRIHALFPRTLNPDFDINLDASNWHWVHCLTLPTQTFIALPLSQKPYKWIRYVIGAVTGTQGDLSVHPDSFSIVDYNASNADLPAETLDLYYHTTNEEKQRICPLGPQNRRTRITSSVVSPPKVAFRRKVAERDGGICVLSGMDEPVCHAVHLVGYSKGNEYIDMLTRHRSRDAAGGDVVTDIDDVQNGLFLNTLTHTELGLGYCAFLMTPNFAMGTDDLDPAAQPTETRCTAHAFKSGISLEHIYNTSEAIILGAPLQISSINWPPDILFDICYADGVIANFGTSELEQELLQAVWQSIFPPAAQDHRRVGHQDPEDLKHFGRREQTDFLLLPYVLIPPDELQVALKNAEEAAEAAEKEHVQEKVSDWLMQCEGEADVCGDAQFGGGCDPCEEDGLEFEASEEGVEDGLEFEISEEGVEDEEILKK